MLKFVFLLSSPLLVGMDDGGAAAGGAEQTGGTVRCFLPMYHIQTGRNDPVVHAHNQVGHPEGPGVLGPAARYFLRVSHMYHFSPPPLS